MIDPRNWDPANRRDFFLGLGLAALFSVVLLWVIPAQIPSPASHPLAHALSPAFLPSVLALLIVVLGLLIGFRAWRSGIASSPSSAMTPAPEQAAQSPGDSYLALLRTSVAIVLSFAYYFALEALGALLSAIVITMLLTMLAGERRWKTIGVTALIVPVLIYALFTHLAGAPLPRGLLGF